MSSMRMPLSPVSPNRGSQKLGSSDAPLSLDLFAMYQSIDRRLLIRGLPPIWRDDEGVLSSYPAADRTFERNVVSSVANWPMGKWFAEVSKLTEYELEYTSDFKVPGAEGYRCDEFYSTSLAVMYDLASGHSRDAVAFFKAEGQLCRVMLSATHYPVRVAALKLWFIMVARFCGIESVVSIVDDSRDAYSMVDRCNEGCAVTSGMFGGYITYSTFMISREALWIKIIDKIRKIRDNYYEEWCYEVRCCGLHGAQCSEWYVESDRMLKAYDAGKENVGDWSEDEGDWEVLE